MHQVIIALFFLTVSFGSALLSEAAQEKTGQNYFENFPSSWTKIARQGQTILDASSKKDNVNVRVIIKKRRDKNCGCDRYAIDIQVNGENIAIPGSVYCNMDYLKAGKVFIEGSNMVLMLSEGDAVTACYVKIEFNRQNVTRMIVYLDDESLSQDSIFQETTYRNVVR
jgi:hypothetical protein